MKRSKDAICDEMERLRRDLRGISPKVSLHKKITDELERLGAQLAELKKAV